MHRLQTYTRITVGIVCFIGVSACAATPAFAAKASAQSSDPIVVLLAGMSVLLTIKAVLEIFGLIPPANKKEIDAIATRQQADFDKLSAMIHDIAQQIVIYENSEILREVHETITGPVAQVCQVRVGEKPPAWCQGGTRSPEQDAILAQNMQLTVALLQSILDHHTTRRDKIADLQRILEENNAHLRNIAE